MIRENKPTVAGNDSIIVNEKRNNETGDFKCNNRGANNDNNSPRQNITPKHFKKRKLNRPYHNPQSSESSNKPVHNTRENVERHHNNTGLFFITLSQFKHV